LLLQRKKELGSDKVTNVVFLKTPVNTWMTMSPFICQPYHNR